MERSWFLKVKFLYVFILYFSFINMIGLLACYFDKRKARKKQFRISEKMLLSISFFGGCFGFYVGMRFFHHKTRKLKFEIWVPIFMIMWFILIYRVVM